MPNAPRTPGRNFRIHDDVMAAAQARAAREGTTVTAVVVAALEKYAGVTTPVESRRRPGDRPSSGQVR